MQKNHLFILIQLMLIFCAFAVFADSRPGLNLTEEEQHFLKKHPVVRAHNSSDWIPFNFYRDGRPRGYTVDYLNLLGEKLGIEIEFVSGPSWSEFMKMLGNHDLDIMANMARTPEREKFALFTKPIIRYPPAIVCQSKRRYSSLEHLQGRKIAVVKGYWYQAELEKNYPDIQLYLVRNNEEALKAVAFGLADATIGNGAVFQHLWVELSLPNMVVSGEAKLPAMEKYFERIGIRNDWPELRSALDKAISAVTYEEERELQKKWLLPGGEEDSEIALTEEEQAFLRLHPVVKVHNEQNWVPFNYYHNGEPEGFTIDLLNLLARKIGVRIHYVSGHSWDTFVSMLRNREIDIIGNMVQTPERQEFALFTRPIALGKPSIVSNIYSQYHSMDQLQGKTVAVVKGFWHEEVLGREYPGVNLLLVDSTLEALEVVVSGEADATIGSGPVLQHLILENTMAMIALTGEADIRGVEDYDQRIAVRSDWPLLLSIMDKALASLSYTEMHRLKTRWLTTQNRGEPGIDLSEKEKQFLQSIGVVRVHNEMAWPPFNYYEDGEARGYSIEYMDLVARKAGIPIRYVSGPSWNEFLLQIKDKELDVMLNIVRTPERQKYIRFTDDYIENPNVIVSSKGEPYPSIESLKGKIVAIPKGFFYEELLSDDSFGITLLLMKNQPETLKAVALGKADAALGELAVVEYLIEKKMYSNLQMSGEVDLGNPEISKLRIGVRNDWPILRDIIQKAMGAVSPAEVRKLKRRWLAAGSEHRENPVVLSPEERNYLEARETIRMCVDPHWMPYEQIDEEGKHVGMGADFMDLFTRRLGIEVNLVPTTTWSDTLDFLKERRCDIISMAKRTDERSIYADFTSPYVSLPYVVTTTAEKIFVEDLSGLMAEKFSVIKGYSVVEDLRRQYPDIQLVQVEHIGEGLRKVREREVFGYIDATAAVGYKIQKDEMLDVKISGKLEGNSFDLSIAVRNDEPILAAVFQKAVNSLTSAEVKEIYDRWISIKLEQKTDYSLAIRVLVISIIILAGVFYWNRLLSRERQKSEQALLDLNLLKGKLEEQNVELERLAATDHLTGLHNRMSLEKILWNEMVRSERYGQPFGVVVLDVDNFKEVNDNYGHQVGDLVLKEISELLRRYTRKADSVGRWGGEEFIIVCPETDVEGVWHLCENLRRRIASHAFIEVGSRTASFGLTIYRAGDSLDDMVQRADTALYESKEGGRNMVTYG